MAALEEFSEAQVAIAVSYQSREMFKIDVDCSDGCCVYYQVHSCEHAPSRKRVELPYADDDETVGDESRNKIELTNRVLMGMKNGLLLEYDNNDKCIYAKRRCRTVVYYHSSQYHSNDNPVKIATDQKVKIFDYQAFNKQLITWLTNNLGKPMLKRTEPFKRHKIFFSFGQTWQPYLEKHKELGENRPQPTALDSRLVSMVVVPLKAKDMVMATQEGRESSETISMGLNQNFFFISLEGSSQICSSLERMAQRIRKLEEQDKQRLQQPENMSIDPETSSYGKLLEDCLDLQDRLSVLQQQNPHQQCQQPQQYDQRMEQQQWMEQQHHMEQQQQIEQQQQLEELQLQQQLQQQQQQQQQHFQDFAYEVTHHELPQPHLQYSEQQQQQLVPGQHDLPAVDPQQSQQHYQQMPHMPQLLPDRVDQLHQDHMETQHIPSQQPHNLHLQLQEQPGQPQQADNGMIYFNWGNGEENQIGLTSEEWLKLARLIETNNLLTQ